MNDTYVNKTDLLWAINYIERWKTDPYALTSGDKHVLDLSLIALKKVLEEYDKLLKDS
jgi:hypothetical protein